MASRAADAAFVYAARALAGAAEGLVKIGMTVKVRNPVCRLKEVASDWSVRGPIEVLWGVTATVALERELHSWFADSHCPLNGQREWFRLADADLEILFALGSEIPRQVLQPRLRGRMLHSPRINHHRQAG